MGACAINWLSWRAVLRIHVHLHSQLFATVQWNRVGEVQSRERRYFNRQYGWYTCSRNRLNACTALIKGWLGWGARWPKKCNKIFFNLTAGTGNQLTIKKKHRVPISMLFHRPAPFQVPTSTGLIFLNRCFLHWINNREVLAHSLKDCLAELYRNKAALPFGGSLLSPVARSTTNCQSASLDHWMEQGWYDLNQTI